MSRPKNFPDELYIGMTTENELIVLNIPKKVGESLLKLSEKIKLYILPKITLISATVPQEPDNAPGEATDANLPIVEGELDTKQWICGRCGFKFDDPKKLNGIDSCSQCNSQHLIRIPEKHHRRTTAEIEAAKEAEKIEQDKRAGFNPQDKLNWRCTACGAKTDTPHKFIKGQFKGMLQCPSCGLKNTMVKNEVTI